MKYLKNTFILLLVGCLSAYSNFIFAQSKNQQIFDGVVDYINCQIAQLSLEEQDNGNAPHIEAFAARFQCDKSPNNAELVKFLNENNLGLNVKLNNSINEFKNKFTPTLNKNQLVSLIEDDLLEVRLEGFSTNHVDSYNILRKEFSKYIGNAFDEFDKKLIEEEIPEEELVSIPEVVESLPSPKPEEKPSRSDSEKTRGIGFFIWMIIGAFIGALLYNMFLRYFKRNPVDSPESNDLRAFRNKNNALQNELENLRLQNSTLLNEISGLKKEIFSLSEKLHTPDDLMKTGLEEEE